MPSHSTSARGGHNLTRPRDSSAVADARPAFRPDLEGLRGIAILLVVLFHAGVPWLRGGFVGVDVFFVLSGFFITTLLARELTETGEVDAARFYSRRAIRLLPALLLTLVATLGWVFWLYAPIDRAIVADVARWVGLSAGNVGFALGSVDYFSFGESPLLHTWSLGVEEQFYVVWPLLVLAVGLATAAGGPAPDEAGRERIRRRLFFTLVAVGVVSFGASLWLTRAAPSWAFFGLPARGWEFALGGGLAIALGGSLSNGGWMRGGWTVVGLAGLGVAVVSFDRATPYPGTAALVPALGTALLVVGGLAAPTSLPVRLLGAGVLRWLGQLSYGWYLWHWPLIGLAGVLNPAIGVGGKLAWSAIAIVPAWLTHRFVESPARSWGSRWRAGWILSGAAAASLLFAVGAHGAMRLAERQAASPAQQALADARMDRLDHGCWSDTADRARECVFGDRAASTTVVLFGDSHAEHWLGALDAYGRQAGLRVILMVKGGCPVADMPELMQPRLKRFYHECTRYREAAVRRIIELRPAAAILSSWDHYVPANGTSSDWHVSAAMWERGLRRTYERLSRERVPVLAVRGTPRTWFDAPACLSRQAAGLRWAGDCTYERAHAFVATAIEAQTRAAAGLGVRFIDMNDRICGSARCEVSRNGLVLFTDDNHLTYSFSRSLAPVFGQRLTSAMQPFRHD